MRIKARNIQAGDMVQDSYGKWALVLATQLFPVNPSDLVPQETVSLSLVGEQTDRIVGADWEIFVQSA